MKKPITAWGWKSVLLLVLLVTSCTREEGMQDDYVMQVKHVGLRKGVLLRRYRLTGEYGKNQAFTAEMLKRFVKEILEPDYLLIEDAYRLGRNEETDLRIMLQEHKIGLLASRHPIHAAQVFISNEELRKIYQKKTTKYDIELIQTPSYWDADSIFRSPPRGEEVAPREARRAHGISDEQMGYPRRLRYQGLTYGEALPPDAFDRLSQLQAGEISAPLYVAPFWSIITLDRKYANSGLQPYDDLKRELAFQGQAIRRFENLRQLVDELKKKYEIGIRKELFPKLIHAYVFRRGRGGLDKTMILEVDLDEVFIKVRDDEITMGHFISTFNRGSELLTAAHLTEPDLDKYVENLVTQHLLYLDALEKGADRDELVRDMLENKEHRTLLAKYLKEELYDKVTVSEAEARSHYALHRNKWSGKYEDVAAIVKDDLRDRLLIAKKNDLIKRLRDQYDIRYNERAFAELAKQLTEEKASPSEEK